MLLDGCLRDQWEESDTLKYLFSLAVTSSCSIPCSVTRTPSERFIFVWLLRILSIAPILQGCHLPFIYTLLGNPMALPNYPRQPLAIPTVQHQLFRESIEVMFVINFTCGMYAWVSVEGTNFVFVFREKAIIDTSAAGGAQFRSFCFTANLFHLPMGKYIEIFFASIASLVPSNEIDISLFECLGQCIHRHHGLQKICCQGRALEDQETDVAARSWYSQNSVEPARTMHTKDYVIFFALSMSKHWSWSTWAPL